jgi:hypothetical protein
MSNTLKTYINAIDETFDTPKCSRNAAEIFKNNDKTRIDVDLLRRYN